MIYKVMQSPFDSHTHAHTRTRARVFDVVGFIQFVQVRSFLIGERKRS